jgi:hypothetical protein
LNILLLARPARGFKPVFEVRSQIVLRRDIFPLERNRKAIKLNASNREVPFVFEESGLRGNA